ncbi:MAG: UvrD-helicase domain-containing protein [Thermoanaerobaculia bacterium]|jgi:ATP-dependent helicase/nuclease subunit A
MVGADLQARDEAARRAAHSVFDRPLVVVAGAGTGKTTILVSRVLSWCLDPGWEETHQALEEHEPSASGEAAVARRVLEGVVAITFTEAAAAEMANRVAATLAQIAGGGIGDLVWFRPDWLPEKPSEELLESRARALIGALDHLTIRTIHAYCRTLLSTYSLEARLAPDLQVDADGRLLRENCHRIVESAAKSSFSESPDAPLSRLATLGFGPQEVADALYELASRGLTSRALAIDPFDLSTLVQARDELIGACVRFKEIGSDALRSQTRSKIALSVADALDRTLEALSRVNESDGEALAGLLIRLEGDWPENLLKRLREWSSGSFNQSESAALGSLQEPLAKASCELQELVTYLREIDPILFDLARRSLQPLMVQLESELRASGIATFQSLLAGAHRLLKNSRLALKRERSQLRQLLVDEFQDTDRLQSEIVSLLALEGDTEKRPGLFVVGDPKQSIYGWRNADLTSFDAFVERAEHEGAEVCLLAVNFRSTPAILDEVSRAFRPVMIYRKGLQPDFEPLLAHRDAVDLFSNPASHNAAIEYWISWPRPEDASTPLPDSKVDEIAHCEAAAIAQDIRHLHDAADMPWGDFGLLLRATTHLETYLDAFRDQGVPFVVGSSKQYYRRREIIEASALVRAIINPVDHVALVAFLRSATAGLPDAALLRLWGSDFPALLTELTGPADSGLDQALGLVEKVAHELDDAIPGIKSIENWQVSVQEAVAGLALLRQSFRQDPPDRFVELLRRRLLFDVTEAARYLGHYRLANLERFFRQLEVALEERGGDIQAILRTLRRGITEAEEEKEALPEDAVVDAVQVMTIHGAKGLQFRHVYLAQAHASPPPKRRHAIDLDPRWIPGEPADYVLFGNPTLGFRQVDEHRRRVESAELVRTLYVALTRAEDRLVVAGNWPEELPSLPPEQATTYLDLLRHRIDLPASPGRLLGDCIEDGETFQDTGFARWRFPGLGKMNGETVGADEQVSKSIPLELAQSDSRALSEHTLVAGHRMARPFQESMSADAGARLERLLDEGSESRVGSSRRHGARAVGELIHRLFETWDLDEQPGDEWQKQQKSLLAGLSTLVPEDELSAATERATNLLERIGSGDLLKRFIELRETVLGREIPVLLAPLGGNEGPVGFYSGAIDLLYRCPETARPVIVDFKTDWVESDQDLAARARVYASQEDLYAAAVQRAMKLERRPDTELWFLWADRRYTRP